MNKIGSLLGLITSAYFIFSIGTHLAKPGEDTDYTRMLVFTWLSTIPIVFVLIAIFSQLVDFLTHLKWLIREVR